MANLRTTVILKTDIVESTPRIAAQTQAEMGLQRTKHQHFISNIATTNLGSIFQEEGDGYWIEFPSVTSAVLAAIEIHQNLRSLQTGKGEKQRLAIRAVITVGDILHQGNDAIGTTMSLTARIEKVTPPDGIYLSHAAWLILNKAEVPTSFVNEFSFRGFREPERVYKVEQKHRTRVLTDQYIVITDVRGWSSYTRSKTVEEVEQFLMEYDDRINEICEYHGGVIRGVAADEYFITFSEASQTLNAIEKLCQYWESVVERHGIGISILVHKGNLNVFRSYVFGNDIHFMYQLAQLSEIFHTEKDQISVVTTAKIRDEIQGTSWENRFQRLDRDKISNEKLRSVFEEYGAYSFIAGTDRRNDGKSVNLSGS
jgi:class 3 adenylate cyclase